MLHQLIHPLVIYTSILLVYLLILSLIYPFAVIAKLEPIPPESSTMRVELTISAPAPAGAYPNKITGTSITTTFVFADEWARIVTDFLAGYNSPSRSDLLNFLQGTDGTTAGILITHQGSTHVRNLTLLGKDAEDVLSFLAHCFDCQLASHADELNNEPVSRTA